MKTNEMIIRIKTEIEKLTEIGLHTIWEQKVHDILMDITECLEC